MSTKRESNYRFAPQLKALRLEKGLNQQEFALDFAKFIKRDAPFSFTTISAWEVGRKTPSLKVLNYLSAYFGVSADYILGLTSKRDGKGESFTLDKKTKEEREAL
ncbi:MAG: helix-turn-helix transcriptional regulator, partial [Lachnospiraceae bacterium]|nr:helix-turn-helix transcriptional regulator [Lachnospiraceae bacterium]